MERQDKSIKGSMEQTMQIQNYRVGSTSDIFLEACEVKVAAKIIDTRNAKGKVMPCSS